MTPLPVIVQSFAALESMLISVQLMRVSLLSHHLSFNSHSVLDVYLGTPLKTWTFL